ncbi:MAG: hypothetical protein M0R03_08235 [Novosphingobium sp.]|nr:hypothetical protein [Novosphingobium sp.]
MRALLLSLVAAATVATPALANEARLEGRGGVVFNRSNSEAIAGVAAGYDWDLGDRLFAGVEVSGDKLLESNTRISAGGGIRAGEKMGTDGRLYGIGTYQTKPCKGCDEFWTAGAGYQHALAGNVYAKVEYRHLFLDNGVTDADTMLAGLGVKF